MVYGLPAAVARLSWSLGLTSRLNQAAKHIRVLGGGISIKPYPADAYQVLLYHRVNPEHEPFLVEAVHPDDFEQQIVFLKRHYALLDLGELWRRVQERTLPPNAVAITFDDGYVDNHRYALPVLRKHGVPATLFLVSDAASDGEPLWFDKVLYAFKRTSRRRLTFEALGIAGLPLDTVAARLVAADRCLQALRERPDDERRYLQHELQMALRVNEFDGLRGLMIDWDQARELDRAGFSIEAHTSSHPILSRLSPGAARAEVVRCRRAIEHALQKEVRFFAYPNGKPDDFDESTKDILREAGFSCAFTALPTKNTVLDDPFALGRATPWFDDLARFALLQARINLAG